jgi:hypothetical protein
MARKKIIPKRVGRFKVPKGLRRAGDRLLTDPRAREVASGALLAAATALASRKAGLGAARGPDDEGAKAASGDAASRVAEAVAQILGEVVDTVRRDIGRAFGGKRAAHPEEASGDAATPEADSEADRVH